jgi:hypothetical protein
LLLVSAYRDRAEVFQNAAAGVGGEAFIPKDDLDLGMVRTWLSKGGDVWESETRNVTRKGDK